jgi:hypothetical protein
MSPGVPSAVIAKTPVVDRPGMSADSSSRTDGLMSRSARQDRDVVMRTSEVRV